MNLNESLNGEWNVDITLRGPDGNIKQQQRTKNIFRPTGIIAILDMFGNNNNNSTYKRPSYMDLGTGTHNTANNNNYSVQDLAAAIALGGRLALNNSGRNSNTTYYMERIFAASEKTNSAITEAGIMDLITGGYMYFYTTFTAVNKGALDSLTIKWTLTAS